MNAARYDFLLEIADKYGNRFELLRSATRQTVQDWIEAHLSPDQLLHVRNVSLDEFARDVTDGFWAPVEEDDREASRADYLHQREMEEA